MAQTWNPIEVLELANDHCCVGYAPSMRRKCRNRVNQGDTRVFRYIIDSMVGDKPDASILRPKLESLASHGLCLRNHRTAQGIKHMVEEWSDLIRASVAVSSILGQEEEEFYYPEPIVSRSRRVPTSRNLQSPSVVTSHGARSEEPSMEELYAAWRESERTAQRLSSALLRQASRVESTRQTSSMVQVPTSNSMTGYIRTSSSRSSITMTTESRTGVSLAPRTTIAPPARPMLRIQSSQAAPRSSSTASRTLSSHSEAHSPTPRPMPQAALQSPILISRARSSQTALHSPTPSTRALPSPLTPSSPTSRLIVQQPYPSPRSATSTPHVSPSSPLPQSPTSPSPVQPSPPTPQSPSPVLRVPSSPPTLQSLSPPTSQSLSPNLSTSPSSIPITSPQQPTACTLTHVRRLPVGEDCPVCYEDIIPSSALVWCRSGCGRSVHASCFDTWRSTCPSGSAKCMVCRTPWAEECGCTGFCDTRHVRRREIDDNCSICLEDLRGLMDGDRQWSMPELEWCKVGCGRSAHKECFDTWRKECVESRRSVRCTDCRADWVDGCEC